MERGSSGASDDGPNDAASGRGRLGTVSTASSLTERSTSFSTAATAPRSRSVWLRSVQKG